MTATKQKTKVKPGAKIGEGVENIDIHLIRPNQWNRKIDPEGHDIKNLAASMVDAEGKPALVQPIIVRRSEEGTTLYEIVAGERRFWGGRWNGWETIPAIVRDMDDNALKLAMAVENFQRKDPEPLEQAAHLAIVLQDTGGSIEEAAARLGATVAYVRRRARLVNLIPDWRDELASDNTLYPSIAGNVTWIEEIAKFHPDVQKQFLESQRLRYANNLPRLREIMAGEMRVLSSAPWDARYERAHTPKCADCVKRTDREADLFAEIDPESEEDARCTDRACWTQKTLGWLAREARAARKANKDLVFVTTEYRFDSDLYAEILDTHSDRVFPPYSWGTPDADGPSDDDSEIVPGFVLDGESIGVVQLVEVRKDIDEPDEALPQETEEERAAREAEAERRRIALERRFAMGKAMAERLSSMDFDTFSAAESDTWARRLMRLCAIYGAYLDDEPISYEAAMTCHNDVVVNVWGNVRAAILEAVADLEMDEAEFLCANTGIKIAELIAATDIPSDVDEE